MIPIISAASVGNFQKLEETWTEGEVSPVHTLQIHYAIIFCNLCVLFFTFAATPRQDLNLKVRSTVRPPTQKRTRSNAALDNQSIEDQLDDSGEESSDGDPGTSHITANTFHPINVVWDYADPEVGQKYAAVTIVAPSGISASDISSIVQPDGNCIKLTVRWPDVVRDYKLLHNSWIKGTNENDAISPLHPTFLRFRDKLKCFRRVNTDRIYSTAILSLPFAVQRNIFRSQVLGWKQSGLMISYLMLPSAALDIYNREKSTNDVIWVDS